MLAVRAIRWLCLGSIFSESHSDHKNSANELCVTESSVNQMIEDGWFGFKQWFICVAKTSLNRSEDLFVLFMFGPG